MIAEGVVLLRIQYLQQGRGRIATEILAQFVNFIEQEQGVAHTRLGQTLQNFARHRTNVGAAMAADLRLITHATQCHANKFSIRRPRDRLTKRCLSHARRTNEAKNWRLNFFDTLLHGEVFQDSFLDLVQSVVIVLEHLLCMGEIIIDLGFFLPRQANKHINVITNYGRFSRHRRHQLEFLQLGLRLFTRLFGHLGSDDFLVELFKVRTLFALTEFFLNRFDLLVQIILSLRFFHLPLDATTDTLLHLQNVELSF